MRTFIVPAGLIFALGCPAPVSLDAPFACEGKEDCAAGYDCDGTTLRCVRAGQGRTAPILTATLTPEGAVASGAAMTLEVTITGKPPYRLMATRQEGVVGLPLPETSDAATRRYLFSAPVVCGQIPGKIALELVAQDATGLLSNGETLQREVSPVPVPVIDALTATVIENEAGSNDLTIDTSVNPPDVETVVYQLRTPGEAAPRAVLSAKPAGTPPAVQWAGVVSCASGSAPQAQSPYELSAVAVNRCGNKSDASISKVFLTNIGFAGTADPDATLVHRGTMADPHRFLHSAVHQAQANQCRTVYLRRVVGTQGPAVDADVARGSLSGSIALRGGYSDVTTAFTPTQEPVPVRVTGSSPLVLANANVDMQSLRFRLENCAAAYGIKVKSGSLELDTVDLVEAPAERCGAVSRTSLLVENEATMTARFLQVRGERVAGGPTALPYAPIYAGIAVSDARAVLVFPIVNDLKLPAATAVASLLVRATSPGTTVNVLGGVLGGFAFSPSVIAPNATAAGVVVEGSPNVTLEGLWSVVGAAAAASANGVFVRALPGGGGTATVTVERSWVVGAGPRPALTGAGESAAGIFANPGLNLTLTVRDSTVVGTVLSSASYSVVGIGRERGPQNMTVAATGSLTLERSRVAAEPYPLAYYQGLPPSFVTGVDATGFTKTRIYSSVVLATVARGVGGPIGSRGAVVAGSFEAQGSYFGAATAVTSAGTLMPAAALHLPPFGIQGWSLFGSYLRTYDAKPGANPTATGPATVVYGEAANFGAPAPASYRFNRTDHGGASGWYITDYSNVRQPSDTTSFSVPAGETCYAPETSTSLQATNGQLRYTKCRDWISLTTEVSTWPASAPLEGYMRDIDSNLRCKPFNNPTQPCDIGPAEQ